MKWISSGYLKHSMVTTVNVSYAWNLLREILRRLTIILLRIFTYTIVK